jgi:O-antigen/teichoic acid export membrane protein
VAQSPSTGGYEPSAEIIAKFGKPAAPPPNAHAPPEHRGLGRSSIGVFVLTTLIQVMGVVSTYAVTHTFAQGSAGLAVWGEIGLYLLIASSINWLGDLRVGAAYTYYISRGQPAKELTGTYLGLRLVLVSGISVGILLATLALGSWANVPSFQLPAVSYTSLGLFLSLSILWTPWMVISQLRIARGSSIRAQYPQFVEVAVRTVAIIAIIYLAPGLLGFTLAFVIGGVASFAYCLPELLREMSPPAKARAVQMLTYSWPLMGSLMFQFLASNAPPFFVTGLLHNGDLFAAFSWDNGWRILLLSVPSAVVLPMFPYLASFHARGEYALVQRKTWEALRFTAMIVLPASIAIVVYRVPIANNLTNAIVAHQGTTFALLAVSAIPLGLSQVIGTALNSIGYQRLELYISGTIVGAMVASTVIAYLLFPVLASVAAGVLVGSLAALALNSYFMEHLLRVRIRPIPILRITAAAGAAFLMMAEVNKFVNPTKWTLGPLLLLGFAVYAIVLAAIGELTRSDVKLVTGAVGLPDWIGTQLGRLCWKAEPPS